MAKLRFDPVTYQFYYQVLRTKALRQKLRGLGGIQSDAGTIPGTPA